jgi:DNA-binding XRE family transcriptional regulator
MIIEIKRKRGAKMGFGRNMLEFRARNNLTQKQLAEIIGVDINTIHRTETEKTTPTKRNKIKFENKMKEWEEK